MTCCLRPVHPRKHRNKQQSCPLAVLKLVIKAGIGLIKTGTELIKAGTGPIKAGIGLIMTGTGLIMTGTGLIKTGTEPIKSGTGLIKACTGLIKVGTGLVKQTAGYLYGLPMLPQDPNEGCSCLRLLNVLSRQHEIMASSSTSQPWHVMAHNRTAV